MRYAQSIRSGGALLVVLPCLLLIELMVVGALAIASVQTADAGVRARQLEARVGAESAVRYALHGFGELEADTLGPGRIGRVPVPRTSGATDSAIATILALGDGRFLASGTTIIAGRPAGRAAALIHAIPRDSLWTLFRATLRADGDIDIRDGASVTASPTAAATADAMCSSRARQDAERANAAIVPAIAVAVGRRLLIEPLAVVAGSPATTFVSPDDHERRNMRDVALALRTLGDHVAPGSTFRPRPSALDGHCVHLDPANWGDPSGITACAGYRPLIAIDGDAHIDGGAGQGMLVVHGNLRIDGGARFDGAIVAAGDVTIGDATITGSIRSSGSVETLADARVTHAICPLWLAFASPAARRAFRTSARFWLPAP
jgi:hypothetical protein